MALDLEEQEQLDALKAWWKAYGQRTLWAVTLIVFAFAAYQAWRGYQQRQSNEAAVLFDALRQQLPGNDVKKIREVGGQIVEKYPRTTYATDAAMIIAKANFENGDVKSAKAQYQWIIDHAQQDQSKDLARLRLATVLLDEKNYSAALRELASPHAAAFDALFNDLKGDVYAAQGNAKDARNAYLAAIDKMPKENPYASYVQLKLDALGEAG